MKWVRDAWARGGKCMGGRECMGDRRDELRQRERGDAMGDKR